MKEINTDLNCSKGGCSYDAQGNYSCSSVDSEVVPLKEGFQTLEESSTCGAPYKKLITIKVGKKPLMRR